MSCSLTVTPPKLQLTSACPGNGTQGVAYGPFTLSATGGLGASSYSFAISGSLPAGVTLSGNVIGGTPQTRGSIFFQYSSHQRHPERFRGALLCDDYTSDACGHWNLSGDGADRSAHFRACIGDRRKASLYVQLQRFAGTRLFQRGGVGKYCSGWASFFQCNRERQRKFSTGNIVLQLPGNC